MPRGARILPSDAHVFAGSAPQDRATRRRVTRGPDRRPVMKKRSPSARPAAPTARPRARPPAGTGFAAAVTVVAVAAGPITAPAIPLQRVRFGYFNPEAREVHLAGSFNDWDRRATPLQRDALGDWSVELELPPGEYRYRFVVDGEWRDDPAAPCTAQNPFGGYDAVLLVSG